MVEPTQATVHRTGTGFVKDSFSAYFVGAVIDRPKLSDYNSRKRAINDRPYKNATHTAQHHRQKPVVGKCIYLELCGRLAHIVRIGLKQKCNAINKPTNAEKTNSE